MATALHPVYSPSTPPFSLPRSIGIAVAVAVHAAMLGVLMMPIALPSPAPADEVVTRVDLSTLKPQPPLPPPPIPTPVRPSPRTPVAAPTPAPLPAPPATVFDTATPLDVEATAADTDTDRNTGDTGPAIVDSLLVRDGSAPRYPREAIRRQWEGEVELLVLVGVDGRVEEVSIARSSGHPVLDRAARDHIRTQWTFVPALRNGQPVSAWARVPVRFSLPTLN